ncbi:hypothetical protein NL676_007103 [Syzygium grande]|nr:hypothetical protein NL676_007103 [Syzygium grande]
MSDGVVRRQRGWRCALKFLNDFGAGSDATVHMYNKGRVGGFAIALWHKVLANHKAIAKLPARSLCCTDALLRHRASPKSSKKLRTHCQLPSSPHTLSYIFSFRQNLRSPEKSNKEKKKKPKLKWRGFVG